MIDLGDCDTAELDVTEPAGPRLHDGLYAAIREEIENSLSFLHGSKVLPRGQRKPNVGPVVRDYLADQIAWLVIGMFKTVPDGLSEWGDAKTEWTWGVRRPDGTPDRKGPVVGEETARTAVAEEFGVPGYSKVLLAREVGAWREARA